MIATASEDSVYPAPARVRGVLTAAAVGSAVFLSCTSRAPPEFSSLPAGLRVSSVTRHYEVRGTSSRDLEVDMVMHGPEVEGHPRYAATAFSIHWSFRVQSSAAGCAVRRPRLDLDMILHVPKWMDRDRAEDELRAAWDTFLDAVRAHEHGHQQVNVDGATRIFRELQQAHSAGGCADLRRAIEPRLRSLLGAIHAANRRYDIDTGGGVRLGVRWPPPR